MQLRDRLRGGRMLAVLALSAGTALPLSAQRTAPPAGQAARMAVFTVADTSIAEALRRPVLRPLTVLTADHGSRVP
jgi:hypothetical protein